MTRTTRWQRSPLLLTLMLLSGFAGLGYQIVWTQQFALWLGQDAAAVLAIVAAFFGGLAVGALALGGRVEASGHPGRWYAAMELLIAAWATALSVLIAPASALMLRLIGPSPEPMWQWGVAFGGSFLLLLPATAAMGATLPAVERMAAPDHGRTRSIAAFYGANTLGAVLGVLATAFWLLPRIGAMRTALVCAALNVLCGLITLWLVSGARRVAVPVLRTVRSPGMLPLLKLAATGLLGIGYEVLVVRVLGQAAENTVYTFAMLLAIYLVGTAAGAGAYQRWWSRAAVARDEPDRAGDALLCALAAACLAGTAPLWFALRIKDAVLGALSPGVAQALSAEAVLALISFGPPTVVMGALFSHLSNVAVARGGASFGTALGVNTLGASVAPALIGVLALPALGPKAALLVIAAGYLLLSIAGWRRPALRLTALIVALTAWLAPPLVLVDVPGAGRLLSHRHGITAAVSVVEDEQGVRTLHINNRQQEGSNVTWRVDARHAWLPLLLHPAPRSALFLGVGTGVTATAAARDQHLEVDAVELLPEVAQAAAYFTAPDTQAPAETQGSAVTHAPAVTQGSTVMQTSPVTHALPLRVHVADARRFVRTSEKSYDVIVADNFHPARSGSGLLYTVEHFAAVGARLADQGVFCQWLPLHQLDLPTLRSIVQSFLLAFPEGWALLASNSLDTPVIGLVARNVAEPRVDLPAMRQRLAQAATAQPLTAMGIEDEFAVLGSFIAGPTSLRSFAADAVANTDDRPTVAYQAPRATYAPQSRPRDRLLELLPLLHLSPGELLIHDRGEDGTRLSAYWRARDRFLHIGRDVRPTQDARAMLAQVREPLLEVLRISRDFRPAYDPLVRMGEALAGIDAAAASALMQELQRIRPEGEATGETSRTR